MEKIERRIGEVFKDGDHFLQVVECHMSKKCLLCYYLDYCTKNEDSPQKCYNRKDGASVCFIEIPKHRGNLGLSIQNLEDEFKRQLHIASIIERIFYFLGKVTKFIIKIKNKVK